MVRFTFWTWIAKTEYQIDIFLLEKFLKIGHFQFYGTFLQLKLTNNEKISLLLNFFIINHCLCKIKNSTQTLIPAFQGHIFVCYDDIATTRKQAREILMTYRRYYFWKIFLTMGMSISILWNISAYFGSLFLLRSKVNTILASFLHWLEMG